MTALTYLKDCDELRAVPQHWVVTCKRNMTLTVPTYLVVYFCCMNYIICALASVLENNSGVTKYNYLRSTCIRCTYLIILF